MTITGWLTKYALTDGLIELEILEHGAFESVCKTKGGADEPFKIHNGFWCVNHADAVERQRELAQKRCRSLQKQMDKMLKIINENSLLC